MIKDGIGGGNTTTGLVFETKADLKTLLNGVKNYSVDKDNNVLYNVKKLIQYLARSENFNNDIFKQIILIFKKIY